jgi:DHA2 family multidrug resistance protein
MALWGIGSVAGSFVGPTLGGFVTEYLSWRYIFYINVPFGLLALAGAAAFLPETERDPERRFDWLGFVSLSMGVGALQLMLDRGGQLDWFESWEIITEACLAVLGLYIFNVHCLTARQPFLDPRLLAQRSFFLGVVFALLYGFLTTPPMVLMPAFRACARVSNRHDHLSAPAACSAMIIGGRVMAGSIRCADRFDCCACSSSWEMST